MKKTYIETTIQNYHSILINVVSMQLPIRNEMKQTVVKINEVQHTKANVTRWFLKARKGNPISRRHQLAIKRPNLGSRATSRNGIKWYIVWNTEHSCILFVYILTKMFPLRLDSWQMKGNSTRRPRQMNDERSYLT